jgi:N-acetylglucosamine malate deacetylase 2
MKDSIFATLEETTSSPSNFAKLSRREFSLLVTTAVASMGAEAALRPKVLAVVAHPDDEYSFAATVYSVVREIGGTVDQVVISNGEGGYRYSILAEQIYGLNLSQEQVGRANLPEIRKQESLAAGRILGIRQHNFLDQKDPGYTLDASGVDRVWDKAAVRATLDKLLDEEGYGFVFVLLPSEDTHGHHKAAAILTLEAAAALRADRRPVVFGVEAASSREPAREYRELKGYPLTRAGSDAREFRRSQPFGYHDALNYQIIANWLIAAHKSQGLFQMDASRHDVERFWRFEASGAGSDEAANKLFEQLRSAAATALRQSARVGQ